MAKLFPVANPAQISFIRDQIQNGLTKSAIYESMKGTDYSMRKTDALKIIGRELAAKTAKSEDAAQRARDYYEKIVVPMKETLKVNTDKAAFQKLQEIKSGHIQDIEDAKAAGEYYERGGT